MRKLQSQGVHHITLVGADRQTSIDFWEGVLGMPFVFEQPNLDNPDESHLYFDPGDGRLITIFTNEGREPDPARTSTDPGTVHHVAFVALAGDVRADGRAPRRARDPPQRRQGPRLHGLDLLHRPARAADRARVLPLRAAARLHARRRAARGARIRVERGDYNIAACTSPTRSSCSSALARVLSEDRSPKDPYRSERRTYGCVQGEHAQAEREAPRRSGSSCGPPGSSSRSRTSGARRPRRSTCRSTRPI